MRQRRADIDGLRGYAALAVMIYHAILHFDASLVSRILYIPVYSVRGIYDFITKFFLIIFNGETAVIFFFVLSGVMMAASSMKELDAHENKNYPGFIVSTLIKRIIRIYPPLIACLMLFFGMGMLFNRLHPDIIQRFSVESLIENCLLRNITMHGATWTLQAEILATPFLIAMALLNIKNIWGGVLLLIYSVLAYDNVQLLPQFNLRMSLYYLLMGTFIPFPMTRALIEKTDKRIIYLCGLVTVFIRQIISHESISGLTVQAICMTVFVAGLYYQKTPGLSKVLSGKTVHAFGRLSFRETLI